MTFRAFGLLAALAAASTPSFSQLPQLGSQNAPINGELDEAERVTKVTETWELKGGSAYFDGQAQLPDLQGAMKHISNVLAAQPSSIRALLLKARTLRAMIVVTPT